MSNYLDEALSGPMASSKYREAARQMQNMQNLAQVYNQQMSQACNQAHQIAALQGMQNCNPFMQAMSCASPTEQTVSFPIPTVYEYRVLEPTRFTATADPPPAEEYKRPSRWSFDMPKLGDLAMIALFSAIIAAGVWLVLITS